MDKKEGRPGEPQLIAALKLGSVKAFDALYDMYYRRIYGYCLNFTKSRKDTEDIVQEVFMKLWSARKEIQVEDSIANYIFSIAKNRLISAFRSNVASPHYEDYLDYCETLGKEDYSVIEYKEFVAMVEEGISKLPPMQQKIVRLSKFTSMSNKEIASLFEISEQTVKNQLVTGLKKIRIHLNSKELAIMLPLLSLSGLIYSF